MKLLYNEIYWILSYRSKVGFYVYELQDYKSKFYVKPHYLFLHESVYSTPQNRHKYILNNVCFLTSKKKSTIELQ